MLQSYAQWFEMFIKYSISLYRKNEMEKGDNTIIYQLFYGGKGREC